MPRLRPLLWILPIYVVGPLFIWFWAAQARGFWLDETLTFVQTQQSIPDVVMAEANGFHPPAFHLGVRAWTYVLGNSTLAFRSYAMTWGLVFVASAYLLARDLYGRRVAAITALLLLYAPFVTWHATEARMYAQMLALGTLASWILLRHERRQTMGWIFVYWAVAALFLLTHYFAGLVMAAHAAYFFGRQAYARGWWRAIWPSVKQFGIPTAAILAWLVFVATFGSHALENSPIYTKPNLYTVFDGFVTILFGYHSPDVNLRLVAAWPLGLIVLFVSVIDIGRMGSRGVFLWALVLVPIIILVVASYTLTRSVYDPRYISILSVPIFIWIARSLASIPRDRSLFVAMAVTLAITVSFTGLSLYAGNNPKIYDLDKAASLVAEHRIAGDAVVIAPDFVTEGWASVYSFNGLVFDATYLETGASAWRIFDSGAAGSRPDVAPQVGVIAGSLPPTTTGRIWLVTTFENEEVQAQVLPEEVRQKIAASSDLLRKWTFRQASVWLYKVRSHPDPLLEQQVSGPSPCDYEVTIQC